MTSHIAQQSTLHAWVTPSGVVANLELGERLEVLFPFPCLSLPSFLSSLPLEVGPLNPARGSEEHCKLLQRGLGKTHPKSNLAHFSFKIHLVATISMIFLRINLPQILHFFASLGQCYCFPLVLISFGGMALPRVSPRLHHWSLHGHGDTGTWQTSEKIKCHFLSSCSSTEASAKRTKPR